MENITTTQQLEQLCDDQKIAIDVLLWTLALSNATMDQLEVN